MDNLFIKSFEQFCQLNEKIGVDGFFYINQTLNKKKKRSLLESYLEWCKSQHLVKVTESSVPDGILPGHCRCLLIDIKVQGKYGVPDDVIYESSKEMRDKVARGNCILATRRRDKNENMSYKFVVRGLKKFSGGMGDEDEDDGLSKSDEEQSWKKYFTKPIDRATGITSLRKSNGEAAHLSVRIDNGIKYLFIGSKNVHLVIRSRDDIAKYVEKRYEMAKKVAHAVCDTLEQLEHDKSDMLFKFMHYTEMTAVMEMLQPDYMHVEDLSHLLSCKLNFITWTSTAMDNVNLPSSFCALPPSLGIDLAVAFGLATVTYAQFTMNTLDLKMDAIRKGYGYEGEVLYFLHETTVIGLIKKKTIWYIVLRATREKTKMLLRKMEKSMTNALNDTIEKMEVRMKEIQKWLELDDSEVSIWQRLSVGFLRWTFDRVKQHGKQSCADGQFPVMWNEYLKMPGQDRLINKLYPNLAS